MGEEKAASLLRTGSDETRARGPPPWPRAFHGATCAPSRPSRLADPGKRARIVAITLQHSLWVRRPVLPSLQSSHPPHIRPILQVGKLKLREVKQFGPDLVGFEARPL